MGARGLLEKNRQLEQRPMATSVNIRDSLKLYLLWLKERGLAYPVAASVSESAGFRSSDEQKPATLRKDPSCLESVIRVAGNRCAPLLVITDAIRSQPLIFGEERNLFLKLLRALKLQPGKDVTLCVLDTTSSCEPLQDRAQYLIQLQPLIVRKDLAGILILGPVAYCILSSDGQPAYHSMLDHFTNIFQEGVPGALVTWHLRDFIRNPELRKKSWKNLQNLAEKIRGL